MPKPYGASPTIDLLAQRPFADLAAALRSQSAKIIKTWMEQVRRLVPSAQDLPSNELEDSLPIILARMADALESSHAADAQRLSEQSPAQGMTRFHQRYDIRELVLEDRLLRRIIIEQTQDAMSYRMSVEEQVALDMGIDIMLQQAVIAFVSEQNAQLRAAAEAELKYLSFLSHDLNNNLGTVTLTMQVLRQRMEASPQFAEDVQSLDAAQKCILQTIGGMGRLLQSERLRKSGTPPQRQPVNMHDLLVSAARNVSNQAEQKSLTITVDAPSDITVRSDGELITLVVQNLVGNAVKYSSKGVVRLSAACADGACTVSVSDEGPGVAAEHMQRIFNAFDRGEAYGQPGVGLGLAIASQAARLLGGKLTVDSKVGVGSTFSLILPEMLETE